MFEVMGRGYEIKRLLSIHIFQGYLERACPLQVLD